MLSLDALQFEPLIMMYKFVSSVYLMSILDYLIVQS